MLLTRHPKGQIPSDLPEGVRHFDYAPFSEILPRCAALVYHGGIGSLSQTLAAGIPHVIMPMAHDQPDNAWRIEQMGIGGTVWPNQFRGPKLAAALDSLLSSPDVQQRCGEFAARLDGVNGIGQICDEIEELVAKSQPEASARAEP